MRFEWEAYRGRRRSFKMYQGDREISHGWVEDYTIPNQNFGIANYAYVIGCNDLDAKKLFEIFREHGLADGDFGYAGYNAYGICPNEDPDSCQYKGTPKCPIFSVIDMVEEALCKQCYFDYDKELTDFKACLDERRALMDECKEYLKEKELAEEAYIERLQSEREYEERMWESLFEEERE